MTADSATTQLPPHRAGKWPRDILAIHENADSYRNSYRSERGRDSETTLRAAETAGRAPVAQPGTGPELFRSGDHRLGKSQHPGDARRDGSAEPKRGKRKDGGDLQDQGDGRAACEEIFTGSLAHHLCQSRDRD